MRPMRSLPSSVLFVLGWALFFGLRATAQAPAVRISQAVNESSLVTLKGNTHPLANAANDRGRVRPDLPMTDLILVLSRSPRQQADFDKFVAAQYNRDSPNYHQWLTADQVGADFGPSPADIATISSWLSSRGFSIQEISRDRMSIRFGGSAAQVESAFHTEIHNLEVKGAAHIGNMSDPKIPAALAPVVVGIKSLHNFFPRPLHRLGNQVTRDPDTGKWKRLSQATTENAAGRSTRTALVKPQFGVSVPSSGGSTAYQLEDVTPYDFATIYNVLPQWNAGTPIDGTGQTIAIAGTSSICLGQTDPNCQNPSSGYNNDVAAFRSAFGLPAYTSANQPTIVSGNSSPLTVCPDSAGNCSVNDLIENTLDVEWAGAVAKGAKIVLVASYPTGSPSDDPLYDSESYIVQNKTASIMNVSYGGCELSLGTAGNVEYFNLWQTAYAEGIAVFVASGDAGAATCDGGGDANYGNPYSAQFGQSVNGLASTPYNTAVGGTDLNWCSLASTTECTPGPYWNTTNNSTTGASAKGYVPEVPWNDTCANPLSVAFLEGWATSSDANKVGGVTDPESGCNFVLNNYTTVDSNAGITLEYIVDTVGGGGGASNCVVGDGTDVSSCDSTTTNTGSGNSSLPLVNDGWPKPGWQSGISGIPADSVRDLPDVSFFASDGYLSSSSYLICVSFEDSSSGNVPCSYSDTTEPLAQEVGGTSVSSPAMAGVMALINQKTRSSQGNPNAELYLLASKQTYSACSAETVTSGSTSCYFNDIDTGNIAAPCDNGADEGGLSGTGLVSPNCSVNRSGDQIGILSGYSAGVGYDQATGLGSLNVSNVVNAWPVDTGLTSAKVTVTPGQGSLVSTSALTVTGAVASSSIGGATPTGTVILNAGGYTSTEQSLAAGAYSFTIPANSLTSTATSVAVSYSGDSKYAAATGSATIAVTAPTGTASVSATATPASLAQTASLSVAVTVTSSGATPTGTVTLSGAGYGAAAQTLTSGASTFNIPASSLPLGSDTLTVTYSGDASYGTSAGAVTVTVNGAAATGVTPTLIIIPSATTVAASSPLNVAVEVLGPSGGATPTGTVTLTSGSYSSGAQTLASGDYTFTVPAGSLAQGSPTVIAISYSGDSTYAAASGTSNVTVTGSSGTLTPTVTVTPGSSSIAATSALSVAVTVTGSGATPSGTVTLTSGSYSSGAQPLTSGDFTFNVPANSLTAGTAILTATYSGDSNYAGATGTGSVTVTSGAATGTFTLSASTTSAVAPGTAATSTVTVTTTDGYSGTASLTCALTSPTASSVTDPPACSLSPTSVALSSSSTTGSVTATVSSTAPTASQNTHPARPGSGKGWMGAGGGAALALLVFFAVPSRQRRWRAMLGAVAVLVALSSFTACGDFWKAPTGNTAAGTTAGTYTFTVTGTGNPTVTAVTTTFQVVIN